MNRSRSSADMPSSPKQRPRLALEIALVLIAKIIALTLIWQAWFHDPETRRVDGERIGAAVYSFPPTSPK